MALVVRIQVERSVRLALNVSPLVSAAARLDLKSRTKIYTANGAPVDTPQRLLAAASSMVRMPYEVVDIDPATVQPFVSDLERAKVSYINAYFDADGSVSSVRITLRPASRYQSLSSLQRDALQLLAQRFGTPDVKYIDHDREKRGHLWYTDSKALDLILEDESIEIEITVLPDPTFFLQPDRYNL